MIAGETPETLMTHLDVTARELETLFDLCPLTAWCLRPLADDWSLTEIACHLRDVENEVHLVRLERVAGEDNAFIPAVDSDQFATTRDYQAQDGPQALQAFLATRQSLLDYLRQVPAETWTRVARHALFGTTSFRELVALMVDHDRAHIEQARAVCTATIRHA